MIEIPLTQDKVAIIDNEDYDLISKYHWFAVQLTGVWYARTYINSIDYKQMHQIIIGPIQKGNRIDHRDLNGLNNRRSNLRIATFSQSNANRAKASGKSSQYKGVIKYNYKVNGVQRWEAVIRVEGKRIRLGKFDVEEDAARAYDRAALEAWGEFARINFPDN